MSQLKKLFDPVSYTELLRGWLIHAHKGRDRHDLAARVYERARYALGIPTLIVSTVVGTSVFAAISAKGVLPLWVGLLSVAAAVLAALQTFLDFPTRAERHRASAAKYKVVIRNLEQMLATIAGGVTIALEEIAAIRVELDTLENEAPVIMPRIFDTIEDRYKKVAYVQEALGLYS